MYSQHSISRSSTCTEMRTVIYAGPRWYRGIDRPHRSCV